LVARPGGQVHVRVDHGAARVKIRYAKGLVGLKLQSAFPEFYLDRRAARARRTLALCRLRRYISVEFPDIRSNRAVADLRVIWSENRYPLFGITRYARIPAGSAKGFRSK
jgi:hypothetical protein